MIIRTLQVVLLCAAATGVTAAQAQTTYDGNGQVPQQFVISGKAAARIHDHISINADTAEKLSKACEDIAKKNNSAVVVVVVDPYGLVVHEHRMDGEGWIQVNATEQKARTALRTRAPSHVLTNRNALDPFTNQNMAGYGLTTQEGGLPIIVNGQLIGAIGVGGIPPAERTATYGEEMCARDALEAVIGPQPPLLPEVAAQRNPPAARSGGASSLLRLALTGVAIEMRDRRRAELEFDRMRGLANAAVEGLLVCEGDTIVTVNNSFADLIGSPAECHDLCKAGTMLS